MKSVKCVFANSLNKILILTLCLFIAFNVSSCDSHEDNCTCEGVETEIRDDYVKIVLTDFVGEHELEIPRSAFGEGMLYGTADIESGKLDVYYDMGINCNVLLFELQGPEEKTKSNLYIDGGDVMVMLEASTSVTGVIELNCSR